MNQFIAPIIDWIGSTHGHGRHEYYGWIIIIIIATSIANKSALKELLLNNKLLRQKLKENLNEKALSATIFSEENNQTIKYIGSITKEDSGYRITIKTSLPLEEKIILNEIIESLDTADFFLRNNSKFILSDFRATNL
jgi:hypothetical protein